MKIGQRIIGLFFYGEWQFFADGVSFTRKNFSLKARLNLLLQILNKRLRLPMTLGIPYCLTVEPASVCNLACSTCPAGLKRKMCNPTLLRLEDFKRTIDLMGDYLTYIQFWSWGEPFLNPAIADMISYAKKKGIIVVSSTNGHFLQDDDNMTRLVHSGLDELILAVDGTTQDVYKLYRQGGDLGRVLEGIRNLVRVREREGTNTPRLHMRMVINPFNENQKDEFAELGRGLGVDLVSYKKIDIGMGGVTGDDSLLPKNPDYIIKFCNNDYPYRCNNFWNFPVLSSDGNFALCSLDSERLTKLNHVSKIKKVKLTLNSTQARAFRKAMKKDADAYPFCKECACRQPDFINAYFDITWMRRGEI